MDGAQDWCLQCGAGAPDSLATRAPSWRSAATVIAALAVLVAGAATAAYAALNSSESKARPATATVGQAPAPAPAAPVAPAPASPKIGSPTTINPLLPGRVKPPKIPLTAATPKIPATSTPSSPGGASTPSTTTPTTTPKTTTAGGSTTTTGGSTTATEKQPEAIVLDTNAAADYNPYSSPASNFGDPSLAIDGDTSTAWTAQVEPSVSHGMAEGLVIDLKTPHKLSAVALVTSSPGMTVQVFGSNGHTPPASITDPAWVVLSKSVVEKKKRGRIVLRDRKARFVTLWISKAPADLIGTAEAPAHVSVNELELFPATK